MNRLMTFFLYLLVVMALPSNANEDINEKCQVQERVCTQGAATKNINGVDIYRPCWEYTAEYYCRTGTSVDTCAGLATACINTSSQCKVSNPNGDCVLWEKFYTCGDKVPANDPAIFIDTTYTVDKDELNNEQCQDLDDNPTCEVTSNVCTEGPETRNINGKPIYKDCWKWEKQYTCYLASVDNYCKPLETICEVVEEVCEKTLANGECAKSRFTYDCYAPQTEKDGIIFIDSHLSIIKDEWDTEECDPLADSCLLNSKTCGEPAETRIINGLPVYKECWRYDYEYTCNSGDVVSTCETIDQERCKLTETRCILTAPNGECTSWAKNYTCTNKGDDSTQINCADQIFCIGPDCYETGYEPNSDFGVAAAYLNAAMEAGNEFNPDSLNVFSGEVSTCKQYALSTVDCCDDSGWANGSLGGCANEDKVLIEQRADSLTHYIGTYCSQEIPVIGTCVVHKQVYCAYNSMLSRIVMEGAKEQLNLSWGTAESPECVGITPEQLQNVRFDLIDFSEYIDQFTAGIIENDELVDRVEEAVNDQMGAQ
ncbi:conjugal transfer protein TraN [Enterovibrio paralichthyis]|uniref:conjugal transfer protein TraN n=1 Tax=Enterovibrio paralichthyis TaxID=2853805 RepID=UPI001C470B0F|nr:conjugal transfer protein TraN [Enterovibrio paralichthyis]MBV7300279.1 conjugal transfer protein TraN [Enterovibrio paralichthyis]